MEAEQTQTDLNKELLRTLYGLMDALDSADNGDVGAIHRIKRCRYAEDARGILYKHYHYFNH